MCTERGDGAMVARMAVIDERALDRLVIGTATLAWP